MADEDTQLAIVELALEGYKAVETQDGMPTFESYAQDVKYITSKMKQPSHRKLKAVYAHFLRKEGVSNVGSLMRGFLTALNKHYDLPDV